MFLASYRGHRDVAIGLQYIVVKILLTKTVHAILPWIKAFD